MLNPLASGGSDDPASWQVPEWLPFSDDEVLVSTRTVQLSVPTIDDGHQALVDPWLLGFMAALRHVTRQYTLPKSGFSYAAFHSADPELRFPAVGDEALSRRVHIRKVIVETAVSWEDLKEVADRSEYGVQPPGEEIYLDALLAFDSRDYRLSMLYSAMALEISVGSALDAIYRSELLARSAHLRIREEDGQLRDPIYASLTSGFSSFRKLLHEQPLYLMQRSLMHEDKPLYDRALRLYATRNAIAHTGLVDETRPSAWEISKANTMLALETTEAVFAWFGLPLGFHLRGPLVPLRRE